MPEWLRRFRTHALFLAGVAAAWETGVAQGWLDPMFFGSPRGVAVFLWQQLSGADGLWRDVGWTLASTLLSFVLGATLAVLAGLAFVALPRAERFARPYLAALNAIPRIALAPLFILWFGLGLASKVAIGTSIVFFIVLGSTVAGVRGASADLVTLARVYGASPSAILFRVVLPGAVPTIFAGLRLGLLFAMLGVVGSEIIASEHGLGQRLAYLGATFHVDGVLAILAILSAIGVGLTEGMSWIERRMLAWQ